MFPLTRGGNISGGHATQELVEVSARPGGSRAVRGAWHGDRRTAPDGLRVDDSFARYRVNLEITEVGDQLIPGAS